MTYEQFEQVGFEEGVPYVFVKLAWGARPWAVMPFHEPAVKKAFQTMYAMLKSQMTTQGDKTILAALHDLSENEFEPGAIESLAAKWAEMMERP